MGPSMKITSHRRLVIVIAILAISLACTCFGSSVIPQSPTQVLQEDPTPTQEAQEPPSPTPPEQVIPELNPSGPWLLISTDTGLWATNPEGMNLTQIWQGDFWQAELAGAIQPGGNQVVILTSDEDRYHHLALNLLSLPDGDLHKITDLTTPETEPGPDAMPGETSVEAVRAIADTISFAWSPDGTKLAFIGVLDGPTADVYLYDTITNAIRRVSQDDAQDYWPSWSPDGELILFFGVEAFGTGAGYAMKGVWSANGDGSDVRLLYEPSSFGEELVGWRDAQTAVLDSWNPSCGSGSLRLYNIVTKAETILEEDCFQSAAAWSWNGIEANPVMFSTSDGLFLLPGDSNKVGKLSDAPAGFLRWDPAGYMLVAKFEGGSMATFISRDGAERYDAPFTVQSPWDADVSMYGLIWAWTDNSYELGGVWITGPGMDIGEIFSRPAYAPIWAFDNSLLFFSGSELGTDLYRATFPGYLDATAVAHLDETVRDVGWVGTR